MTTYAKRIKKQVVGMEKNKSMQDNTWIMTSIGLAGK